MRDDQIRHFLKAKMSTIPIQDFLSSVSLDQLQEESVQEVTLQNLDLDENLIDDCEENLG